MKYGSLEWAQDLLNSTKVELDKINAADEKGKAAAEGLGLTSYYTGLVKALEDEIAKGNYVTEKEMLAKDTSDDEDLETVTEDVLATYFDKGQFNKDLANADSYKFKKLYEAYDTYMSENYESPKDIADMLRNAGGEMRVKKTALKDIDGDGDVDKVETIKINPNILGGVKEFGD